MASFKSLAVVFGFALLATCTLAFTTGISSVVYSLADYQSQAGGFHSFRDAEATLQSTSHALFLSSLFGLRNKINAGEAANFVASLANPDHGFANKPGTQSDVESVRNALLAYSHLGLPVSNPEGVVSYLNSVYDAETKLFANAVGGVGDLKATALALQALSSLGKLKENSGKFDAIKKHLQTLKKSKEGSSYFSLITADNYFGIVAGSFVGFDFGDGEDWAAYFVQRQVPQGPLAGGFYSDSEFKDATVEDTAYSVNALYILEQATSTEGLVDQIDVEALLDYTQHLPRNLASSAHAYVAISRTSALKSLFKITPVYEVTDPKFKIVNNRIVQGSQVKTGLSAKTSYGLPHAGLDVSLVIQTSSGEKIQRKLTWNSDSQSYVSDELFDSNDKLGEYSFDFSLRWRVADLGSDDLVLTQKDQKLVGYDLTVESKASLAGKEILPGGNIGVGAEFAFDLKLGTVKTPKPALVAGDFDVLFEVYDSSGVVIHGATFDARKNTGAISFKYSLAEENIPAGTVTFSFGVKNAAGLHTISSLNYKLPVRMVASHISFKGFTAKDSPKYKIGETVSVEFSPASLPDLRTLHFYAAKDFFGNEVKRSFYMEVASAETGQPLFQLPGVGGETADNRPVFKFELPIDATFTSVGANVISFSYRAATGETIKLLNYDSSANELFEDNSKLTYTVEAELHVTDLKDGISASDFSYGDEAKFTFKVRDELSKKFVWAQGPSSVALMLRHVTADGQTFTSTIQPASQSKGTTGKPEFFEVAWSVNPNAVKGKGTIELVVQGADGKEIQLFEEKSKKVYSVPVTVGGKIEVSDKTYSNQIDESETVFLAEAHLSCNGKDLNGADLRASVKVKSADGKVHRVAILPVTSSGENGQYEVSWIQKNANVVSGTYSVEFYRQVDRKHVLQQSPKSTDDEIEAKVQPLFTVSLSHTKPASNVLPFKTEFLVLSLLVVSFFWTSFRKMDIEGLRKKKNKKE